MKMTISGTTWRNPTFPHESTGDQFFNEEQFEVYRSLGFHSIVGFLDGTAQVVVDSELPPLDPLATPAGAGAKDRVGEEQPVVGADVAAPFQPAAHPAPERHRPIRTQPESARRRRSRCRGRRDDIAARAKTSRRWAGTIRAWRIFAWLGLPTRHSVQRAACPEGRREALIERCGPATALTQVGRFHRPASTERSSCRGSKPRAPKSPHRTGGQRQDRRGCHQRCGRVSLADRLDGFLDRRCNAIGAPPRGIAALLFRGG
jgi:hypothetical protein